MATLRVPVTSRDHFDGDLDAPAVLLEYGDYECPYCRLAHPIVKRVQQHFGDQLCFVYRHFPMTEVHPNAGPAAEAAEFADAHGRFWPMHDLLFETQPLNVPVLFVLIGSLGLSQVELRDALAKGTYAKKVQNDFVGGVRSGVNGTPSFFINSRRHDRSYAFPELVAAINDQLAHVHA